MNPPARPLEGRNIIVTRPASQAGGLLARLEALGARCSCLTLFNIEPLDYSLTTSADQYAGAIFTSRNAVQYSPSLSQLPETLLAVGPGTATALRDRGAKNVIVPEDTRTEGLLDLPGLADIRDQRWLVIKGEGGRNTLLASLRSRGARVDSLNVYRRLPLQQDPALLREYIADADALLIFSGEGLQHLWLQCPEALRSRLAALQLVVPSPRVVKMAQDIGFTAPARPARRMSDEELVAALQSAMQSLPDNDKGRTPEDHD